MIVQLQACCINFRGQSSNCTDKASHDPKFHSLVVLELNIGRTFTGFFAAYDSYTFVLHKAADRGMVACMPVLQACVAKQTSVVSRKFWVFTRISGM